MAHLKSFLFLFYIRKKFKFDGGIQKCKDLKNSLYKEGETYGS